MNYQFSLKNIKTIKEYFTFFSASRWILSGLVFALMFMSFELGAQCPSNNCTITISGPDSGVYFLDAGDKLCLAAGAEYTGAVIFQGGEIENCATLPQDFDISYNSSFTGSKITNNGTMILSDTWTLDRGSTFDNYGTFIVASTFSLNRSSVFNNYGINQGGDVSIGGNSEYHNFGEYTGTSNTIVQENGGILELHPGSTFSGVNLTIENSLINSGELIYTETTQIKPTGVLTIDGGCLTTKDLSISGKINGVSCGTVTASDNTTLNFPAAELNGDFALVDLTPPSSAPFVDANIGTIAPSVTWVSCGCPAAGTSEICNNGIDDDGDGLTDCLDPDCNGDATCPDNDSDGISDEIDLDDDNDGILDTEECTEPLGPELLTNGSMNRAAGDDFAVTPDGWTAVPYTAPYCIATASSSATSDVLSAPVLVLPSTEIPSPDGGQFACGVSAIIGSSDYSDEGIEIALSGLEIDEPYQVSFYQTAVANPIYTGDGRMRIYFDGVLVGTSEISPNTGSGITVWTDQSIVFEPSSATGLLSFLPEYVTETGVFMFIDGISMKKSPFCDEDGDGVQNSLDLDSDNDGCNDVIEAGFTDDNSDGILGDSPVTVDSDGIVVSGIDGYTGTNSFVTNSALQSGCADNDNDGISDVNDLDDDNDGILDTEEQNCAAGFLPLTGTVNSTATSGSAAGLWPLDGNSCTFNFELLGSNPGVTPRWGSGVTVQNNGSIQPDGDYLNLQPEDTDLDANDIAQYTLGFTEPVVDLEFKIGGLDSEDALEVFGFYNSNPVSVEITDVNLGSDVTILGNRVESTAGSSNAPDNSVLIRFNHPVNQVVISSGKIGGSIHSSNYNTVQLFELTYCTALDTDGDFIVNQYDLDSDRDGCNDVLEGDGGFTYNDINNGTLSGGIDANGVPIAAGSSGQNIGSSQDNSTQSDECDACNNNSTLFKDNDLDGIGDFCDLDDDNDGILDTDEGECLNFSKTGLFSDAQSTEWQSLITTYPDLVKIDDFESHTAPANLNSLTFDGFTLNHSPSVSQVIETPLYGTAPFSGSKHVSVATSPSVNSTSITFDEPVIGFAIRMGDLHDGSSARQSTFTISVDGIAIWSSTAKFGGGTGSVTNSIDGETTILVGNAIYNLFGYYDPENPFSTIVITSDLSATSDNFLFDDISFISSECTDTDGDGVENYLDLDSDNDGIYDCVESGSDETHLDGVLTGGSDTKGIPLAVSNGASGINYNYLDTTSSGILNAYNADSDGDGCSDVIEAGFPDADGDGQLGGLVPPTVDTNGKVTSGGL